MLAELQREFLPVLEREWTSLLESSLAGSPMRDMLAYHQSTGGKRLRACAVLLAAEPFLRQKNKTWRDELPSLLPIALAVELIHNATLVHDDIQDGDTHRRGKETLWKKYSTEQAINCGDAFFFLALRALRAGKYKPDLEIFLVREIENATLTVIDGQSQEFALKERLRESQSVSFSEYENVVRGKTAALFSLPYVCGAKVAGASDPEVADWRLKAEKLGIAFQVQDDVLDLWGEKGRASRGMDIAEGKISFPILAAFQRVNEAERTWLIGLLLEPREATAESDIERAIEVLEKAGVRDLCQKKIAENLSLGNEKETELAFGSLQKFIAGSAQN
jgi:geranylgeranyl diphosphate synthase type I